MSRGIFENVSFLKRTSPVIQLLSRTTVPVVSSVPCRWQSSRPIGEEKRLPPTRRGWDTYEKLQKAPLNSLSDSVNKYLEISKPVVSPQEFDGFFDDAMQILKPGSDGEKIQAVLQEGYDKLESWLFPWWSKRTARDRDVVLPLYFNPGCSLPLQHGKINNVAQQIEYASKLTVAALQYYKAIANREIPREMDRSGTPMDMTMFSGLFGSTRIPGPGEDFIRYGTENNPAVRHIVVARKGQFFALDVFDSNGKPLNEEQIGKELAKVVEQADKLPPTHSVGVLSTQTRNDWARDYAKLRQNEQNARSMDMVETALFILCLDEGVNWAESKLNTQCDQILHGGGTKSNSSNRWFDKSLQFVVGENGVVGLNWEHWPAEGPPIANALEHIAVYVESGKTQKEEATGATEGVRHLQFQVPDDLADSIQRAAAKYDQEVDNLKVESLMYDRFGGSSIKSGKMSPDSFFQIAIQVAYQRVHGTVAPTYESAMTRYFKLGRTDIIRTPLMETLDLLQLDQKSGVSAADKGRALRKALEAHKNYGISVMTGKGMDRHLQAVKTAAVEMGLPVPRFFSNPVYSRLMNFDLSTSQIPSRYVLTFYGPWHEHGYAVCYNIQKDHIGIVFSQHRSSKNADLEKYVPVLKETLADMLKCAGESRAAG